MPVGGTDRIKREALSGGGVYGGGGEGIDARIWSSKCACRHVSAKSPLTFHTSHVSRESPRGREGHM